MNTRKTFPKGMTLEDFLPHIVAEAPAGDTGELSAAILGIARAGMRIARAVSREDLEGGAIKIDSTNVHGEEQKALDLRTNDVVCEEAERTGAVGCVVSEEMEGPLRLPGHPGWKSYGLRVDPLDGSSNLGLNVTVGTIFSLVQVPDGVDPSAPEALLLPGTAQAAAGYLLYGPATVLILAAGGPVRSFVLDPDHRHFHLIAPDLRIPEHRAVFSINAAYFHKWGPDVQRLVQAWGMGTQPGGPWSLRYVGSMVADVHRVLIQGGVFFYPGETAAPDGKLRLLYEGQPMAWLIERAGGRASDGRRRLLEIRPETIHQRVPVLIGSARTVADAERTLAGL